MKTKIIRIIMIIMTLFLIGGCASGTNNTKVAEPARTTQATPTITPTVAPTKTPAPTPTATPHLDLAQYELAGQKNFISLTKLIAIPGQSIASVCFMEDDTLAILYMAADKVTAYVKRFSLKTGVMSDLFTFTIDNPDKAYPNLSIVHTNPFVVHESYNSVLYQFDLKGEEVNKIDLLKNHYSTCMAGANGVYLLNDYNSDVDLVSYSGKETKKVYDHKQNKKIILADMIALTKNDNHILLSGSSVESDERVTYVYDLITGEMVNQLDQTIIYGESDQYIYTFYTESTSKGTKLKISRREHDNLTSVCEMECYDKLYDEFLDYLTKLQGDSFFNAVYEDGKIRLTATDMIDGSIYSEDYFDLSKNMKTTNNPDESVYINFFKQSPISTNQDYIVFSINQDAYVADVFLWDINGSAISKECFTSKTVTDSNTYKVPTMIDYGELTKRAEEIENTYNIGIVFGKNVPSKIDSTKIKRITNKDTIQAALDNLDKELARYPKGFFDDLYAEGQTSSIYFYLTGEERGTTADDIEGKGGFYKSQYRIDIIAIDISNPLGLASTLNHEVGHCIYNRLEFQVLNDTGTVFDETKWATFNPKGFEYAGGYGQDVYPDDKYTTSEALMTNTYSKVYFDCAHAKTFITEDFATIFAAAMENSEGSITLNSKYIQKKLDYMSGSIRKVWKTSDWPEKTAWEKALK